MKRIVLLAGALCGALSLPVAAQEKTEKTKEASAEKAAVYKLASVVDEKLMLTDLDGKSLSFKDLRGKVVFIHFWSKDCPFEEVADPKVAALEKRWRTTRTWSCSRSTPT